MASQTIRKYSDIRERLISSLDGKLVPLGKVEARSSSHLIEKVVLGSGNPKRVLISAGIHGDEPAGVETICSLIETRDYLDFMPKWEITLLPCINPFGYERGTRINLEGMDLNRQFKSPAPPKEVALVQSVFDRAFDMTIELHEDEDSSGYYLYQSVASDLMTDLTFHILNEVQKVMPINGDSTIDDMPARDGAIERVSDVETMDWWPMALFALSKGTRLCLTLESTQQFPIKTRVDAHLTAIRTALNFFSD